MENDFKKYTKANYIISSCYLYFNKKTSKKLCLFPDKWSDLTLETTKYIDKIKDNKTNGLIMLTGKKSNVFVLDIDKIDNWNKLLLDNNTKEPNTVKAISGNGGIHYYFKYNDNLATIANTSNVIYPESGIDVRTNGGCIILPPSSYSNKTYKWEKSIFDHELKDVPKWLIALLCKENTKTEKKIIHDVCNEVENIDIEHCNCYDFNHIDKLLSLLSSKFVNDHTLWIKVGLALHNSGDFFNNWDNWSKQSPKYDGSCKKVWESFNKKDNGLTIKSLHHWAKECDPIEYNKLSQDDCITKCVQKFKEYLPSSCDLSIKDISQTDNNCVIRYNDTFCPIANANHSRGKTFSEIWNNGLMNHRCGDKHCVGKVYDKIAYVERPLLKGIFMNYGNITINNYINISNGNDKDNEIDTEYITDTYDIFDGDNMLNDLIVESLNATPYTIGLTYHHLFKEKFNCVKEDEWYIFTDHKWNLDNVIVREYISLELPKYYKKVLSFFKNNNAQKIDFEKLKYRKKVTSELIKSLGKTSVKNNIMVELKDIFIHNNPNFKEKLNLQTNLIGFTNGIYDLKTHTFRDGISSDFVTLCTNYAYSDTESEYMPCLLKFLEDLQPDKNERDYMLTFLSTILGGSNDEEIFHIFTGCGRNGKSKLADLLQETIGDYGECCASTMFTKEQPSAQNPRPELVKLNCKRLIVTSEPENNQKFNSSFIKLITGNDSITARDLFSSNIITFKPQFNLIILCNDIPPFDKSDGAIWDRCRCIEFPSKFVDNPVLEHEKQIDKTLKDKLKLWKNDFMILLIKYYKIYKTNGLKPTKNVMKFTNQIKEEQDIYKQFLDNNTEQSENESIHTSTIYNEFKLWFAFNNPGKSVPSNKFFMNELKKYYTIDKSVRINNKISTGIRGLKMIDND
jgi:P4 family phage/plasmid primase-like protien